MKTIRVRLENINDSKMRPPHKEKLLVYYRYFKENGRSIRLLAQANPIVINNSKEIIDGYCTYIIALASGFKTVPCIMVRNNETLQKVVICNFKTNNKLRKKDYYWKVNNIPLIPNHTYLISVQSSVAPVIPRRITMIPTEDAITYSYFKPLHT